MRMGKPLDSSGQSTVCPFPTTVLSSAHLGLHPLTTGLPGLPHPVRLLQLPLSVVSDGSRLTEIFQQVRQGPFQPKYRFTYMRHAWEFVVLHEGSIGERGMEMEAARLVTGW